MIHRWIVIVALLSVCWIGACDRSSDQPQAEAPAEEAETLDTYVPTAADYFAEEADEAPPAEVVEEPSVELAPPVAVVEEPAEEPVIKEPPVEEPVVEEPSAKELPPPVLDFTMTMLDGQEKSLTDYQGKVLLIVNTASRCGYTHQYGNLQAVHDHFAQYGFSVLGFPANNFGGQEPGTDSEIATFCQANFGVTFDMFSKISVAGPDRHPLYDVLTAADAPPSGAGPVQWNFEKFLVARDGTVVGHYRSATDPADPALLEAIEQELTK